MPSGAPAAAPVLVVFPDNEEDVDDTGPPVECEEAESEVWEVEVPCLESPPVKDEKNEEKAELDEGVAGAGEEVRL